MAILSYHGNSGKRMNSSCSRGLYLLGVVYTPKIPVLGKVSHGGGMKNSRPGWALE